MPTPSQKKPVRYMDFISRKPSENSDPLASRPVPRKKEEPKPVVKKISSVADQIPPKGAHIEKKEPEITVKKQEEKPLVSRKPATTREYYPEPKKSEPKIEKVEPKKTSTPSAPDGNKYTLGGKSPFLPGYTVDKRPLSSSVPEKKTANFEKLSFLGVNEATPDANRKKNVYEKEPEKTEESQKDKKKKEKTVKIIDDSDKKKGVPLFVVILVTILLGAAVGAGVYFLLPK